MASIQSFFDDQKLWIDAAAEALQKFDLIPEKMPI